MRRLCSAIAAMTVMAFAAPAHSVELADVPDMPTLDLDRLGWGIETSASADRNGIYRLMARRDPVTICIELPCGLNPSSGNIGYIGRPRVTVQHENNVGHTETWDMIWVGYCPSYVHYSVDYLGHHDTAYVHDAEAERRFGEAFASIFAVFANRIAEDLALTSL